MKRVLFFLLINLFFTQRMHALGHFYKDSLKNELEENNFFSKTPGTIVAICQDDICENISTGFADILTKSKIKESHLHRVGSLTKMMIAVLILQMVEEGYFDLDESLGNLLPEFRKWSEVTVLQLLKMQSGIPDYLFNQKSSLSLLISLSTGIQPKFKPQDILKKFKHKELEFSPGSKGVYNNTNYVLLGLIIEKYRKQKLTEVLKNYIFTPIGMHSSFLDSGVKNQNFTKGYIYAQTIGFPDYYSLIIHPKHKVSLGIIDATYALPVQKVWASGAVASTPEEMSRFVYSVLTNKILTKSSVEKMKEFSTVEIIGLKVPYGLGLMKINTPFGDAYGHGGVGFGYQNMSYYIPKLNISFTHAQNTGPGNDFGDLPSLLGAYVEGERLNLFKPKSQLIPENFLKGIHLRVKGVISQEFNLRVTGYATQKEKFKPKETFNRFFIESKMVNDHDYIFVKGVNFSIFNGLSKNKTTQNNFSFTFIDKHAVLKQKNNNSDLIVMENSINRGALYSFSGTFKKDSSQGTLLTCVKKINDDRKLTVAQFGSQKDDDFSTGSTFKLLANIPMRTIKSSDRPLIEEKFGFKICSD